MADNAYRTNPGSGELIRTVDKSGVEAQVVILDVGGTGTESLLGDGGVLPTTGDMYAPVAISGTVSTNTTTNIYIDTIYDGANGDKAAPAFLTFTFNTGDSCDADIAIEVSYDGGDTYGQSFNMWNVLTDWAGPTPNISTWLQGTWIVASDGITHARFITTNRTTGTVNYSATVINHAPLYEAALMGVNKKPLGLSTTVTGGAGGLQTTNTFLSATGTISGATQLVQLDTPVSSGVIFGIIGTGVATLQPQISVSGGTYVTVSNTLLTDVSTGAAPTYPLAAGIYLLNFDAAAYDFRLYCSSYTSGTLDATIRGVA